MADFGIVWMLLNMSGNLTLSKATEHCKNSHSSKKRLSWNVHIWVRTQEVANTQEGEKVSQKISTVDPRNTNHCLVARFKH